jgi:arylsulfatase A-like enzyme/Flp pilus assembly protein TadD
MWRRSSQVVLLMGGLLACGNGEGTDPSAAALEPASADHLPGANVLLITIDTLRADALGSYGNVRAETPWIDRLAAEGVRFANARAHNVVTLPTHASILTGLYPQEHGVRDNSGFRLPAELPTLATILRQEGYRTGAFISAFPLDSRFGLDSGFEVYEDSFVSTERRPAFFELERAGPETVMLARSWIDSDDSRPWFCWVHLYEPHFPYEPPPEIANRFGDDPYLGEVSAVDRALAPLLAPLLESELGRRTLVVLTSDHGEALGEHGEATHGIFAYESTLQVPLLLFQPRLLAPRVVRDPVRHIDILPTVLAAIGLTTGADWRGDSLWSLALGKSSGSEAVTYFESLSPQLNRGWAPLHGVVAGGVKYIDLPIPELYDLEHDPREMNNLAEQQPERLAELRSLLAPLRRLDSGSDPLAEDAETLERLRSLGYVTDTVPGKQAYTEEDDPKRLIELDAALNEVATLYEQGNLTAALERARAVVRRRPDMLMALLPLAHLERENGNLQAAIDALQRALALKPTDFGTLALLGAYLTQAGKPEEALSLTEAHARLAEPDIDVLLMRALAQARAGRASEALATLAQARQIAPDNPMVSVHEGTLYMMSGRRDEARSAFQEALAVSPDLVAAHTALGLLALEEANVEAAVEHWQQAVTADPAQVTRLLAVAMQLWNQGRVAAARPLLELFVSAASADRYRNEIAHVRELLDRAQ